MLMIFLFALSEEDQDRIEQIFKDHNLMMYRISYKMLQSDVDAQDAVAQAFLNIMEHFERISQLPSPQILPYCVVIVKNASYDILRKKNKTVCLEEIEEEAGELSDVEERVLAAADAERLARAMERLPKTDRYLLELRYAREMGYKEISRLLGVQEDAAKKRGQRALKKLRVYYEEGDKDDRRAY